MTEHFPATRADNGRLMAHDYRAGKLTTDPTPSRFWTICGRYLPDDTDLWVNYWTPNVTLCPVCMEGAE
jgi:hypothetical protein